MRGGFPNLGLDGPVGNLDLSYLRIYVGTACLRGFSEKVEGLCILSDVRMSLGNHRRPVSTTV